MIACNLATTRKMDPRRSQIRGRRPLTPRTRVAPPPPKMSKLEYSAKSIVNSHNWPAAWRALISSTHRDAGLIAELVGSARTASTIAFPARRATTSMCSSKTAPERASSTAQTRLRLSIMRISIPALRARNAQRCCTVGVGRPYRSCWLVLGRT